MMMKALLQRRTPVRATAASSSFFSSARMGKLETRMGGTTRFLSSVRPVPDEENHYDHLNQHLQQPARFPQRRQTPVRKVPIPPTSSPALEQPSVSDAAPRPQVAEEETEKKSAGFPTATDTMDDHVADELLSPTSLTYTGDAVIPITSVLEIIKPQDDTPRGVWPVFRLMVRLR